MVIIAHEERKTIKKNQEIWYFNEMKYKIDNLIWGVLKNEHIN